MAYRYRELAAQLISDIESNRLNDGQRLLSVRQQSQQRGVSITTVKKCYELLEAQGFLIAKPKSGFYVRRPSDRSGSLDFPAIEPVGRPINKAELLAEVQHSAGNRERIPFGTVQLAAELIPKENLQRSLIRIIRRSTQEELMYGPASGQPCLKNALCEHFSSDGLNLLPEDIMITNGCMEAIALAVEAVSSAGDNIAIASPCFSGQLQLLASLDRQVLELPSTEAGIDLDRLEAVMVSGQVKACLLTGCNQNPLGYNLSVEDKQRIAAMASKYDCPIIEDDVFGECGFTTKRQLPIKAWDKTGHIIWCSSFSKSLIASYRLGWCAPGRFLKQVHDTLLSRSLSVNTPLQLAMADFIRCGEYRRHLANLRLALPVQVNRIRQSVIKHFGQEVRVSNPTGGYSLWVQLPKGCDGISIFEEAAQQGINIVPGVIFTAGDIYKNCIRLNAGNPWSEKLDLAISKLAEIVKA
ncbi:PLP-dependent aminotransferase family protein [uncultured Pseudoteredinibacter sp.]|uniref:aminotransferase-like domain-containing protein n=1 Tax=uncultured Pseudoteredinibacter sp. TaxID=1641701 RepID=UPI00262DCB59|nr:PLP-dependent aminotransferase family protein [uncultured Pseudoteredinibacter sp.]